MIVVNYSLTINSYSTEKQIIQYPPMWAPKNIWNILLCGLRLFPHLFTWVSLVYPFGTCNVAISHNLKYCLQETQGNG